MTWLQALILGIVQGLTEFLPVSSSGHLAIFKDLLGVETSGDLLFEVVVHAATVLATIVVFWKSIVGLLKGLFKFKYNDETDYICKMLVATIPILIVGLFFKDYVEEMFSSLWVVGICLLVTAGLLFFSDRVSQRGATRTQRRAGSVQPVAGADVVDGVRQGTASVESESRHEAEVAEPKFHRNGITWWQALAVGVGQAFAVLPGLSRSGTTISTGLLCGVRRDVIAQFSFLMVMIPILGDMFLELVGGSFAESSVGALPLCAGFVSAFVTGLFACKAMMALVRKAQLKWFALYCLFVGAGVIVALILK